MSSAAETRPRGHALGGVGAVTAGAMVANVAAYLLHLPASRWLGPEGYGVFAALVSVQLLVAVPALALQAVVAREVVAGVGSEALRALGHRVALAVAALAVLAVAPLAALLHAPAAGTAAALATGPLLCLVGAEQGLAQGAGRFGLLGALLAVTGVAKVAPVVLVLACGGGTVPALAAGAAGIGAAWLPARALVAASAEASTNPHPSPGLTAVLDAAQTQLVVIALTSVDLLLARALLPAEAAGVYALGSVATKAALWLPQAVGAVLYPRLADAATHAAALRRAWVTLAGIGVVVVAAAAVGAPLAPALAGREYAAVTGQLWAFAALGAVGSILSATLTADVAARRSRRSWVAWLGLAVLVVGVLAAPRTPGWILGVALAVLTATTGVVAARAAARPRG